MTLTTLAIPPLIGFCVQFLYLTDFIFHSRVKSAIKPYKRTGKTVVTAHLSLLVPISQILLEAVLSAVHWFRRPILSINDAGRFKPFGTSSESSD